MVSGLNLRVPRKQETVTAWNGKASFHLFMGTFLFLFCIAGVSKTEIASKRGKEGGTKLHDDEKHHLGYWFIPPKVVFLKIKRPF